MLTSIIILGEEHISLHYVTLDFRKLELRILKEDETITQCVRKVSRAICDQKKPKDRAYVNVVATLGRVHPGISFALNRRELMALMTQAVKDRLLRKSSRKHIPQA